LLELKINKRGQNVVLQKAHLPYPIFQQDFLMAKQAVSYFIGIQSDEHRDRPSFIPYIPLETLTNSRTNEQMTCKKGQLLNPQLRVRSLIVIDTTFGD
jgi:hypothetical protein